MTYTSLYRKKPRVMKFRKPTNMVNLIVHGQGVLVFNSTGPCYLTFCDASGNPGLYIQFTKTAIIVNAKPSDEPLIDLQNSRGICDDKDAYYWFSLDSQNLRLYGGIGEARVENLLYQFQSPDISTKESMKKFFESLVSVRTDNLQITALLRDPISSQPIPLLVGDTDEITMDAIAAGTIMPKANLPLTSQKLYEAISGKRFALNTADFPNFVRAIERSIATPGLWCYERLKQKASEFDKDKPNEKETYLRITLGENNGESPGIPYVMEIWPSNHYSPVHNHGGSTAIIRVLHGAINVSLFPYLGDSVLPFAVADFAKGDVTWISTTLNQIHQLKNTGKDTCITIQCYMYEGDDVSHYDYFDYLDGSGATQQFEPDSDMGFGEFKRTMKSEWATRRCWGL